LNDASRTTAAVQSHANAEMNAYRWARQMLLPSCPSSEEEEDDDEEQEVFVRAPSSIFFDSTLILRSLFRLAAAMTLLAALGPPPLYKEKTLLAPESCQPSSSGRAPMPRMSTSRAAMTTGRLKSPSSKGQLCELDAP
jgi:hypothetical protein